MNEYFFRYYFRFSRWSGNDSTPSTYMTIRGRKDCKALKRFLRKNPATRLFVPPSNKEPSDRRISVSRSRAKGEPSPLILGPTRTDSSWYKIKGWHASTKGGGEEEQEERRARSGGRTRRHGGEGGQEEGRVASPPSWGMTERVG